MNGRLYDPLLRRFLNADENIQDPNNTQNYNKYGYVLSNPLMYNDPNGEIFFLIPLVGYFWSAVIVGATIGLASYVIGSAIMGEKITLMGALKATFWGAVSGAATFGIGSIFSSSSGTLTAIGKALGDARILVQGAAHAISQGTLSLMQGGSFWSGAAAGFLGHMGGELWGATMKGVGLDKFAQSTMGMVTFGAISGGIGAELSGGNFWQGAVTGGIVAGLNSALHKIEPPKPKATFKILRPGNLIGGPYSGQSISDINQYSNSGSGGSSSLSVSTLTNSEALSTLESNIKLWNEAATPYNVVGTVGTVGSGIGLLNNSFGKFVSKFFNHPIVVTASILSAAKSFQYSSIVSGFQQVKDNYFGLHVNYQHHMQGLYMIQSSYTNISQNGYFTSSSYYFYDIYTNKYMGGVTATP